MLSKKIPPAAALNACAHMTAPAGRPTMTQDTFVAQMARTQAIREEDPQVLAMEHPRQAPCRQPRRAAAKARALCLLGLYAGWFAAFMVATWGVTRPG